MVENILDDIVGGESFYDPTEDKPNIITPEGEYYAHVKDVTMKSDVVIRGKYLADIYNIIFKLAPENSDKEFMGISGSAFIGKEIRSKGFFRFKTPDKSIYPNLEENSGSNKSYMELIESFGVETEADNEGRFFLPNVDESDIVGMPVILEVFHDEWTDNQGNNRTTPKAGAIFTWDGQKRRLADLPF